MTTAIETPQKKKSSVFASLVRGATIAVVLLFCVWLSIALYFGDNSLWMQYQASVRRAARRAKLDPKINAEINTEIIKSENHPWAGEYSYGDGLGEHVFLTLAPKAGYVYELYGCLGFRERLYGKVVPRGDRLELLFAGLAEPSGFICREYIPVSWGERHYLIPSKELEKFCRDVNSGYEPREGVHGWYFLRRGDEKKQVSGLPQVPKEYQSYLRMGPILAELEAVKETQKIPVMGDLILKRTVVSLKGGRDQGVRPGLKLYFTSPQQFSGIVNVRSASPVDPTSDAVILWNDRRFAAPEVGWKLSSEPSLKKN